MSNLNWVLEMFNYLGKEVCFEYDLDGWKEIEGCVEDVIFSYQNGHQVVIDGQAYQIALTYKFVIRD